MKTLSLKLKEVIFDETESLLKKIGESRNSYINKALDFYNGYQKRKLIAKQLKEESALVSEDSMTFLKSIEYIDEL